MSRWKKGVQKRMTPVSSVVKRVVFGVREKFNRLREARIFPLLRPQKKDQNINTRKKDIFDPRRRTFLKYALFGSGVFLLGKYLNPIINLIQGDVVLSEKTFQNFKVTETGKQLKVMDDEGDELLIIDKEGF